MDKVTVLLAIMDFFPVILFGVGSMYLLRIGYHYLTRSYYTAMAGGAILCFTGGLYKASSKLMEAFFEYSLAALESSQFIMLAPGFVLLFIASLGLLKQRKTEMVLLTAPAMELWKIPFIAVMSLANMGYLIVLVMFSLRNKLKLSAFLYAFSILTLLFMSYLSTRPMTIEIQWIAQSINSIVQLFAAAGHYFLYHHLFSKKTISSTKGM